jgi:glycosyltransferase EpsF
MDHQSGLAAAAAKKAGVKRRLCHAHLDTRGVRGLALKKMAGRVLIDLYITQRCACSTLAGEALYGRRAVKKGLGRLVNNGIDLTGYAYREAGHREALLKECGVTGDPVLIGNVARLDTVKNQDFILDVALEAKKRGLPYVFVFAGIGRSQEHLLEKRARLELGDNTFFLGNRKDIPQLLQSMDLFLLPSLREGLPLTIVEAQSAGLPIVAADCVPLEADMGLGLMERLSLQDGIETWLQAIQNGLTKERPGMERRLEAVRSRGFDVKSNVAVIMDLYGV